MGVSVFKTLRSKTAKTIYVILAAAFFIGFGILSSLSPKSSIGSIKISGEEVLQDEFLLLMKELERTDSEISKEEIENQAFETLIARKIISKEIENWGLKLSHQELLAMLGSQAGISTRRDYINFLRSQGVTQKSFENYIRDSYNLSKFQDIIVRVETSGELDEFQDYLSRALGIRYVTIAEIDKSKFKIDVNQKEIERYYILNRSEFKIGEKREIWIAKFDTEEKAKSFFGIQRSFSDFSDFESSATGIGGRATSVILGKEAGTQNPTFAPFFAETATEGVLTPPINVGNEWWVVKIHKIYPERIAELKEAESKIREKIIAQKVFIKVKEIIDNQKDKIKSQDDFKKTFSPYSLSIYEETFLPYLEAYPKVEFQPELSSALISKEENFVFPKPIENKGNIFVVFVGKILPDPTKISDFFIFDIQRNFQSIIVREMPSMKIEPKSKQEAIKKLLGNR